MLVKINNPTNESRELTALSELADAGDSSLTVLNTDGFSEDDYIVIRQIGDEQAELHKVSSVSSNSLNLNSTLSFSHHVGAEIFIIPYNQIEVSRKLTASSDWTVLTTIDIEPDSLQTVYEDTQGQTSYYYKVRFYNSDSGQYSSYSAEIKGSGASTRQAGKMIDIVLRRANDRKAEYTTRAEVMSDLNLGYQQVCNALMRASSEYYQVNYEIATEDYKHEYTLPDNFREIIEIKDGNGTIIKPVPVSDAYYSRGYELTGRNELYIEDVPEPANTSTVTKTTILENNAYDESGSWIASEDAENVTTDNDEYKSGSGSVNFDIDVSESANDIAVLTNSTFTAVDLDDYDETGKIRAWVYLPDVTHINTVTLRWGSDASNYWSLSMEKDYKDHSFHDGWNYIEFNWSDATETGTVVPTAIDYLQFRIAYDSTQSDDTDFRLDSIIVANTWDGNDIYEVKYLKKPAEIINEMDEFEIPEGYQFLLVNYAAAHIYMRQGKEREAGLLFNNFEQQISRFISESAKRTRRVIGLSVNHKRNYRFTGRDSTRVVHSDGNVTDL